MAKLKILDERLLDITVSRLAKELIENYDDFADTVLLGMQPKGVFVAERIKKRLKELSGLDIPLGYLDATFHRDDFRRRDEPIRASETRVPFQIEGKKVVLIDDVLFTGRTIRSGLDAMLDFGRPDKVELLVLVDRQYSRHFPIEPDYTGRKVNTIQSQRVIVEWAERGFEQDCIWLVNKRDGQ